ncbi:MAG: SpoIIE family protein phosphatase [Bacteroidia bacterium]
MEHTQTDIGRLASFPEQNPNPVIEINMESGLITYSNPAALRYFPDLAEKNSRHPLFQTLLDRLDKRSDFNCEVTVGKSIFEQKIYFIQNSELVRVYSTDVTEQKQVEKKLANLALFPEQNPNPVIEVDIQSGLVSYTNPAALRYFPDIKLKNQDHPVFAVLRSRLSGKSDFQCEIVVDDVIFEQKIYFIENSEFIRVYCHDITKRKEIEKSLTRLASFPEQNPSPIIELDLDGNVTYFNPACLQNFKDFFLQQFGHEMLKPLRDRYEQFRSKEIDQYSVEISYEDKVYTQRGKYLPDHGVIRIFNLDITQQKASEQIIREKNKDITDSINYAKKIQRAILPAEESLLQIHPESFVLYQPKDVISGDFYWLHAFDEYLLFACADCTGHGVPGALMSMIGSNLLGHIVSEKQVTTPHDALAELDRRVIKALRQDQETENRDGMDIAFCSLHAEKKVLHYSGANRPLVIVRNGEIIEYTPSKFPVGGKLNMEKVFGGQKIQLQKEDCIYLFTDGITDQFGGPQGKKLMKRKFCEFLLRISTAPMQEQKQSILNFFEAWKGELEQLDDVLVMGFRI